MKEYQTKSTRIILRSDGILELANRQDWNEPDTLEEAKETTDKIKEIVGDQQLGFLVEAPSRYASKEILNHYRTVEMGGIASAVLLNSFAAKIVGNLYFKLSNGKPNESGRIVPTRLFTDKKEATKWLYEQLKKYKS